MLAATKEGPLDIDDIDADHMTFIKARGHAASMVTLGMESYARQAPDVSFVHDFPGPVKSGIARDMKGVLGFVVRNIFGKLFDPLLTAFVYIPPEESGAFHLFFSTSARYPAADSSPNSAGVPVDVNDQIVKGSDGKGGSGMYSIDEKGEPGDVSELQKLRDEGLVDKIRQRVESEWMRILKS